MLAQAASEASTKPLLPTWLTIIAGVVTLIILGAHMTGLQHAAMPASRKRIRIVNGWLMFGAIPLLCYAFGIAVPAQTRSFVLVWAASVGVVGIIVMLAVLDILNNWRLHRRAAQELRREVGLARLAVRAAASGDAAQSPAVDGGVDQHDHSR